jgi:hypothetical protein
VTPLLEKAQTRCTQVTRVEGTLSKTQLGSRSHAMVSLLFYNHNLQS